MLCRLTPMFLAAAIAGGSARVAPTPPPRAVANDNRTPSGRMERDTLVLRLTVTTVAWHILGDDEPAFTVLAFAEQGKPPTIPGPLIRVPSGTPVQVRLSNPLDDTLIVRGLGEHPGRDSLLLLPGAISVAGFASRPEGTYQYWATAARVLRHTRAGLPPKGLIRRGFDSQLVGAIVIDRPGPIPQDRIFVITQLADRDPGAGAPESRDRRGIVVRQFGAVNGRSWPHTERLHHELGDSVRWRIVNASPESHPMHLHGFYFRVDSHGSPESPVDSIYTPEHRRMVVTETISPRHTVAIAWSPDRPGGWLFHCHLTSHVARMPPIDRRDVRDFPTMHHDAGADQHAITGMNGMVLGITVTGEAPAPAFRPARRLRLFVQSDSSPGDRERRFGYVLQRGAEPRRDSVEYPGPVLVLTRGEPTSIEVVNRSGEPTAVHWHGIELESYFDGVPGWSGTPGVARRTASAVRSGERFEVRLTPRRAGTFMYHTHFDELRQQFGGLVGALVVLEPGERWEPERDLIFLLSDGATTPRIFINGSLASTPKELEVGMTYRLRFADIAVFRMALSVRLLRDSTLVQWRPIAKDGFALPPAQATVRPSIANVPTGETADFEFTPDAPGDLLLFVGPPGGAPQGSMRLRVSGRR